MDSTEILLLRHGESEGNLYKIFSGHNNVDLTERGIKQAKAAADFLLTQDVDIVCSSDLCRAYNTALEFSKLSGIEIFYISEKLREIFVGEYEGLKSSTIIEKYDPDFSSYYIERFGTYSFPGGETTYGAGLRLYEELKLIGEKYRGRRILVATHSGVIRSFWGIINDIPREELGSKFMFPSNASVSRVIFDGEGFVPKSYSESDYLSDVGFIDYTKARV